MNKNEPKYLFAERKIRKAIGHLDINDKIPGERIFAKDLGVSYMTVRKAIDGLVTQGVLYKVPKKGTFIADGKAVKKKTKNIGYFLDNSIKEGISSPYYSMIFDALQKEARNTDHDLMYFSDASESVLEKTLEKLDGLVISCFPRLEHLLRDINRQVPIVCIDNSSPDKSIASVTLDNFNAVIDAINYLCSLGHERIGFITGLDDSDVGRQRLGGYLGALRSNGIDEDTDLIYKGDYSFGTGESAAEYFLSMDKPPSAIMCANDTMAIGAIKETRRLGLSAPEDISIVGFDDINIASHLTPALTTVKTPVAEIAKQAVALLDSIISGKEPDNIHIILPCQLVLRGTCGPRK